MKLLIVLAAAAFCLAVLRLQGVKIEAFQALAHLFVGGLCGASLARRRWAYLILALALTAVEAWAFVAGL